MEARRPRSGTLLLLALLAAGSSMALLFATGHSCDAPSGRESLIGPAVIAGGGALLSAWALSTALRRESGLLRAVVAFWAAVFFVAAWVTLSYVVGFFLHCAPD